MGEQSGIRDQQPVTPPLGPWLEEVESPQTPHSSHSQLSSLEDTPITPPDQYSTRTGDPPRTTLDLTEIQSKSLQLQRNVQTASPELILEPLHLFQPTDPFSDLHLEEIIGHGQWSKVYKAWNGPKPRSRNPRSPVYAAKIANSKFAMKVIKHEAHILTYLSSDPVAENYVMKFYGFDMQHQALINEYLELPNGMRISELLKPTAVARDLAHGLDFLHAKDVIHGDIKPSNIYIRCIRDSRNLQGPSTVNDELPFGGHRFRAIYGDFSAARLDDPNITMGESAGTYDYMAPELFSSNVEDSYPTKASDVYALGVTLMTVVAGQGPYDLAPHLIARRTMAKQGTPLHFMQDHVESWRRLECYGITALLEMAVAKSPTLRCNAIVLKHQADQVMANA